MAGAGGAVAELERGVGLIRPRVTILDLIAVVGLAACVFAFARSVGDPADVTGWMVVLLLLLSSMGTSVVGIVYHRGGARAFCVGFTTFGGLYAAWLTLLLVLDRPVGFNLQVLLLVVIYFPFAWIGGRVARRFARETPGLPK
jgi:hypothetical protein